MAESEPHSARRQKLEAELAQRRQELAEQTRSQRIYNWVHEISKHGTIEGTVGEVAAQWAGAPTLVQQVIGGVIAGGVVGEYLAARKLRKLETQISDTLHRIKELKDAIDELPPDEG